MRHRAGHSDALFAAEVQWKETVFSKEMHTVRNAVRPPAPWQVQAVLDIGLWQQDLYLSKYFNGIKPSCSPSHILK